MIVIDSILAVIYVNKLKNIKKYHHHWTQFKRH